MTGDGEILRFAQEARDGGGRGTRIAVVLVGLMAVACTSAQTVPIEPAATAVLPLAAPRAPAVTAPHVPTPADFYRGKTVRIIVGTSAGGGYDLTSRLLARHMPRYLPGNPTIVVENRPGAGGALAANTVYRSEPQDGTVLLSFISSLTTMQALDQPGVEFDSRALQWLGSTDEDAMACAARSATGVRGLGDITSGRPLVIGTPAPGIDSHDAPAVLRSELGVPFKLVPGFQGPAQMVQAMDSGEIDGFCIAFKGLVLNLEDRLTGNPPAARIFAVLGDMPPDHPFGRELIPAEKLATTEEARRLLRVVNAGQRMNKAYAVAPGVPPDRVEALRLALDRTYADAAFVAESNRAKLDVKPMRGRDVSALVSEVLSTPPSLLEKLKTIVNVDR